VSDKRQASETTGFSERFFGQPALANPRFAPKDDESAAAGRNRTDGAENFGPLRFPSHKRAAISALYGFNQRASGVERPLCRQLSGQPAEFQTHIAEGSVPLAGIFLEHSRSTAATAEARQEPADADRWVCPRGSP
jgi:hypothetical protein